MLTKQALMSAVALMAVAVPACDEQPSEPNCPVGLTVDVEPDSVAVAPGDSADLKFFGPDNPSWSSHDSTIATIDSTGTVFGVAPGLTSVRAAAPLLIEGCERKTMSAGAQINVTEEAGQ